MEVIAIVALAIVVVVLGIRSRKLMLEKKDLTESLKIKDSLIRGHVKRNIEDSNFIGKLKGQLNDERKAKLESVSNQKSNQKNNPEVKPKRKYTRKQKPVAKK